ncbi:MAG: NAD(P)H-dependent oxidoreductase subunit E, partial [Solirubrobacteraceae bacterium]
MDLVISGSEASATERAAIDDVLGPPGSIWEGASPDGNGRVARDGHIARGGHAAREQRHLLLPVLHAVHARVGWISPGALNYVCRRLTIPPAEAHGVASFYALFSLTPQAPVVAHVCTDIACLAAGSESLCAQMRERLGPPGAHDADAEAGWLESPCLGMCERAPAALVAITGEDARELTVPEAT